MASRAGELILECKRQAENCLYTSTTLFIWLRTLRRVRIGFIVLTASLGSIASWNIFQENAETLSGICALSAGLLPAIYSALKFDDGLEQSKVLAAEFKNLQDRFRQAALIGSKRSLPEFESELASLLDRLEEARKESPTPPEWCFRKAQEKVKKGDYDYDFDVDLPTDDGGAAPGGKT
jgi:hypothetical protein